VSRIAGTGSGWTVTEAVSYIVQGRDVFAARAAVEAAGGRVVHELGIINAVSAELTAAQRELLTGNPWLRLSKDGSVKTAGAVAETWYPTLVNAVSLHNGGTRGHGITIAVLDTGLWKKSATQYTAEQRERILAQYDVIAGRRDPARYRSGDYTQDIDDGSGHGTHVSAIAISSDVTTAHRYQGVAPSANIVAVKAFSPDGAGSYADVIKGIDWIVANRAKYRIRVLNLSFSATPQSAYWDDPLNQAVMKAWASGIVVVVSAGNEGPGQGTIGVPGNVPYVITVGAMTDATRHA
jgi:serine protease AprX